MLLRLIDILPAIEWKKYTEQLMYNKSIPIEWIYYNDHLLDGKMYNYHKITIGLSAEPRGIWFDGNNRSLDDIKFLRIYNMHHFNDIIKLFDNSYDIKQLDYYVYLYLNSKIARDVLLISKPMINYILKLSEFINSRQDLYLYDIFKEFTINELDELMDANLFDELDGIETYIDYAIVDALHDNKYWNYIKDKLDKKYKYLFMNISKLIANKDDTSIDFSALSIYTTIPFEGIKKSHTLNWRMYDFYWNEGLMTNRHLYISDLAELFYEFINKNKSKLNFIKTDPDTKTTIIDLANAICKRYDLTTELVKEYFKPEHYIYFIKHPAIDLFKLYDGLNLPINEMLGNPSLSYKVLCKYIPLADDLSHLAANEFDNNQVYKKVKLYRQKQNELSNSISIIINIPLVVCNIISSYHVF